MSSLHTPPRIATAILYFFANQPDFPAVLGDLKEEFQQRVQNSNSARARRWFWRETFRNVWALSARELLTTPIRTLLTALFCFLTTLLSGALFVYFFQASLFPLFILLNILQYLAVGRLGGMLLAGREWALVLAYTLVSVSTTAIWIWYAMSTLKVDPSLLGTLIIDLRLVLFCLGCLGPRGWAAAYNARKNP